MKDSILFLPASIRSHVVPALYVADLLRKDYDIHFAITSDILEEIVIKEGHCAVRTGNFRVALGMESQYVFEKKSKISKWETLKSVLNNELYEYRQTELSEIIDRIKPSAIFIDIFNSTDLLVLYPKYKQIKFLFLNPMLSTYRVNCFPTVDEGHWPEKHLPEKKSDLKKGISFNYFITRPFQSIMATAIDRQFEKLTSIDDFHKKYPIAKDRTSALLFDNIPEIILAPLELEVSPDVRKPN